MTPKSKALSQAQAPFKPLKWGDYEKLDSKSKEGYNKKEREYNFNKKLEKNHASGKKKLSKFFSNI